MQADKAKVTALGKLTEADEHKKPLSPQELLEVFDHLGEGVKLSPEVLRAVLEVSVIRIPFHFHSTMLFFLFST